MGNIGILAIGGLLIFAVLFIGYKMDTAQSASARKSAKAVKTKKSKAKKQDVYEYTDKEESDIYTQENLYDMSYNSDDEDGYETDYVSQNDLAEEDEYEEDDISLFEQQPTDNYTFNNDIDDNLDFETYDSEETVEEVSTYEEPEYEEFEEEEEAEADGPEAVIDFGIFDSDEEEPTVEPVFDFDIEPEEEEIEVEIEPEPEPEKPKRRGRPKKVKEEAPKAPRGKKAKKEVEPKPAKEPDFSSTMIFDVDKLNAEIDDLDNDSGFSVASKEPEIEYTDAVDMDSRISELDDEVETNSFVDGPFKPVEEDAESFMDKINKMKEAASVEDFSGFSVDTRDEDLKAAHKKYTKKKTEEDFMNEPQISFMPEDKEEKEESVDIGFLAEMEKTLKQNQKDRMTKGKKKE